MSFLLGPLGGLRALPSPHLGNAPQATATRVGAVHRSLTGRPTVDRLATRRAWTFVWPYLDADTHAYLDALHQGVVTGPLWLLDPSRPNRLAPEVAATGSAEKSRASFSATNTLTLTWVPLQFTSPIPLAGGISWNAAAVGATLGALTPVPVIPGETITFSAYAAADRPLRLGVFPQNVAGASLPEIQGTLTTPGPAGTRLTLTAIPQPDAVACRVGLVAAAGPAATTVTTSGWQLEPGPAATSWQPGGGTAQVLLDSLPVTYPVPGSYGTTLTLLEV